MPELPEVETIVRQLRKTLPGRTIRRATLTANDLYRTGSRRVAWLRGGSIRSVDRLGKAIHIAIDSPSSPNTRALVVHLGMTGRFVLPQTQRVLDGDYKKKRWDGSLKHRHGRVVFEDGAELWYVDPRRFGYFHVGVEAGLAETLGIGPDPFDIAPDEFAAVLAARKAPIKSLLLNQKVISGIGNIYADEVLFRAETHPLTPASRVAKKAERILALACEVLGDAIRHGGTTFRDYRKADGTKGSFQQRLAVYGREGEECLVCSRKIRRVVISGRSSHYCSNCQRPPR